ncbi:hypothetical protein FRC10_012230 [Ceratobasidium sp. 414]|nr:hypothetical protein FRC10_012230 [Ceratobasidium sp. 414]
MLFSAATFSLAIAAAASALTITVPDSNGWKNGTAIVSWTSTSGDLDVFSGELCDTKTPSVISPLAVTNNINTSAGTYSFQLPPVLDVTTYQCEFVNVTNINQVYATSIMFPIVNQAQAITSPAASSGTVTGTSPCTSVSAKSAAPTSCFIWNTMTAYSYPLLARPTSAMHLLLLLALSFISSVSLHTLKVTTHHVLHAVPTGWEAVALASADHLIDMCIRLKQVWMDDLLAVLAQVSDLGHVRCGMHLSKVEVDELVTPHSQTVETVKEWLDTHDVKISGQSLTGDLLHI